MPRKNTKHPGLLTQEFNDFQGGLNTSLNSDTLQPNELSQALNVEYDPDSGRLRTRGGLKKKVAYTGEGTIKDIIPFGEFRLLMTATDPDDATKTELFEYESGSLTSLGSIDGVGSLSHYLWEDDEKVALAAGGKISTYDGTTLSEISDSPETSEIGHYAGRLRATTYDSDSIPIIKMSKVGDETDWTLDPADDSAAKEIQVGYKDGMDIAAVAPLARDLLVFKSPGGIDYGRPERGCIYRLVGIHPNWEVYTASPNNSTMSFRGTLPQGNIVYFLNGEGLVAAQATEGYKEVQTGPVGIKINPEIRSSMGVNSRIFHVPSRQEIWILPSIGPDVYVMNLAVGKGAFTRFQFPKDVYSVCSQGSDTYVLMEDAIYEMGANHEDDDGTEISCVIGFPTIFSGSDVLIKRIALQYEKPSSVDASIAISSFRKTLHMDIPFSGSGDIAYSDDDIAFSDDDILTSTNYSYWYTSCQIRGNRILPRIESTGGGFSLYAFIINLVEV